MCSARMHLVPAFLQTSEVKNRNKAAVLLTRNSPDYEIEMRSIKNLLRA
jgi:hypothetical protein